jgi:hypothetical protein
MKFYPIPKTCSHWNRLKFLYLCPNLSANIQFFVCQKAIQEEGASHAFCNTSPGIFLFLKVMLLFIKKSLLVKSVWSEHRHYGLLSRLDFQRKRPHTFHVVIALMKLPVDLYAGRSRWKSPYLFSRDKLLISTRHYMITSTHYIISYNWREQVRSSLESDNRLIRKNEKEAPNVSSRKEPYGWRCDICLITVCESCAINPAMTFVGGDVFLNEPT